MKASNKIWILIGVFLAITLVGCKEKPTPAPQPDTSVQEGSGDEGWITVVYEYTNKQSYYELKTKVEQPLIIKKNEEGRYLVHGSRGTTYYTTGQTLNQDGNPCYVHCDFPISVNIQGRLATVWNIDTGRADCQFELSNTVTININDYKRYGDCPYITDKFDCATTYVVFGGVPEESWKFTKQERTYEPKMGEGIHLKISIKSIEWPGDMAQVCKWDQ